MGDYEMRFDPLPEGGQGLVFPCDERGRVDMDALDERARNQYLYARAMQGRQFAARRVVRRAEAAA